MRWLLVWLLPFAPLWLTGCGGDGLTFAEDRRTTIATRPATGGEVLPPGRPSPLAFSRLVMDLPTGTEIGGYSFGLLCAGPYTTYTINQVRRRRLDHADTVYQTLNAQGFDMVGDPARLFEEDEDRLRAEMLLAGRVRGLKVDLCRKANWLTGWAAGTTGEGRVRIDWSIYDRLRRQLVMQTSTEGRGKVEEASFGGLEEVLDMAVADAVAALGRLPAFRAAIIRPDPVASSSRPGDDKPLARATATLAPGRPAEPDREAALARELARGRPQLPDPIPTERAADRAAPSLPLPATAPPQDALPAPKAPSATIEASAAAATVMTADPLDDLVDLPWIELARVPEWTSPLKEHADQLREATVLIAGGAGHGSGFFIDPSGLVLTNYHVVGNAHRVRVVLSDGVALVGSVQRINKGRDVALVKVPGAAYPALPVRRRTAAVSEDVFAIGAPLRERNAGTVSKGIVSALRTLDYRPVIQADVMIQGGSSGGPLVDANGNLIGMAVAGMGAMDLGLNYFIPIGDALRGLNLKIGGAKAETPPA